MMASVKESLDDGAHDEDRARKMCSSEKLRKGKLEKERKKKKTLSNHRLQEIFMMM